MKICPRCGGKGHLRDEKAIGQSLRKLREAKSLTLREVAKSMGLSIAYICDLEHGRRVWSHTLETKYKEAVK